MQIKESENNILGKRVDKIVLEQLKTSGFEIPSRSFLQNNWGSWVLVNGKEVKRSYKIRIGEVIDVNEEYISQVVDQDYKSDQILAEEGELNVVFEDENFLVINKKKGVVVHPGVKNDSGTLANFVRYYLEQKNEFDVHIERCGVVHRLDKGVSGLIVFAKNLASQKLLKGQFENHEVEKLYLAKVEYGEMDKEFQQFFDQEYILNEVVQDFVNNEFRIDSTWYKMRGYIGRDNVNRMRMIFREYDFGGSKRAITYIKRLNEDNLLIKIETGRMHQIRATLKSLGINIIGDSLYGDGRGMPDKIELESIFLAFKDFEGKYIVIKNLDV
jgi:23S rRNA pseudouridine1911/1915/1917 synthase